MKQLSEDLYLTNNQTNYSNNFTQNSEDNTNNYKKKLEAFTTVKQNFFQLKKIKKRMIAH